MKAHGPKLYKKLKHSGEIQKEDFKFVPKDAEVGFSVERNRQVIEDSIAKTDKRIAQLKKEYSEQIEERVDAASYFLKKLTQHKTYTSDPTKAAEYYFGRRELAKLRGEDIKQQIMAELRQNAGIMKD